MQDAGYYCNVFHIIVSSTVYFYEPSLYVNRKWRLGALE